MLKVVKLKYAHPANLYHVPAFREILTQSDRLFRSPTDIGRLLDIPETPEQWVEKAFEEWQEMREDRPGVADRLLKELLWQHIKMA